MKHKYIENYNLTRFLYARDEVELSLVVSLLEKKNIKECYYWAFELYYSNYDISQLIWKIFYDFYFHYNSTLEKTIYKNLENYNNYYNIANIIRKLFSSRISSTVFKLRQAVLYENYSNFFKRKPGRPPNWLNKYDKIYIPLIISINKSNYLNIAFYLYDLVNKSHDTYLIFVEIIKYFTFDHKHDHDYCINNFKNRNYCEKREL